MSATANGRQAFLIGVGNMIAAEGAYAKRNHREMPPVMGVIWQNIVEQRP